jgi:hypothetical protein
VQSAGGPGYSPDPRKWATGNRFSTHGKRENEIPRAGDFRCSRQRNRRPSQKLGRVGEEKSTPGEQRPKHDDGEPTPIFDAVFSATRAQAKTPNPPLEPDESGR